MLYVTLIVKHPPLGICCHTHLLALALALGLLDLLLLLLELLRLLCTLLCLCRPCLLPLDPAKHITSCKISTCAIFDSDAVAVHD